MTVNKITYGSTSTKLQGSGRRGNITGSRRVWWERFMKSPGTGGEDVECNEEGECRDS